MKHLSSIESIKEFAKKFHEGTKLNQSKVNDDTLTGEVISVDYANDLLFKELHSQIDKDKLSIWFRRNWQSWKAC
nr:hypothetical protein [Mycoplasmopsis bovis]